MIGEFEFFGEANDVGAACGRHGHAERILNGGLNVERGQMRLAMRFLHGVGTDAVFVHCQRHQRDAEPCGDALDEGIGQRLHAAAAAGRHHGGKRGRDALPAVGGEDDLFGVGRPAVSRHEIRGDVSGSLRPGAGALSQRDLERFRPVQPFEAFRDHRRLDRQPRIIDFEVDAGAARLGQRGRIAALHFAGDEGAAADLADHEAASEQFGVDAARGRGRDLALIGKRALRRQAIAGFEPAIGDFGGNGIGKSEIFESGHYCTESNVFLAPIQLQDHLGRIKSRDCTEVSESNPRSAGCNRHHAAFAPAALLCRAGANGEGKCPRSRRSAVQPSIPTFSGMVRWAGKGALALATWLDRRAGHQSIGELDDRALRDIGIHRSQIEAAVTGNLDLMRMR